MNQVGVISALSASGLYRGLWVLDDLTYETVSPDFIEAAARKWVDDILPTECTEMRAIGATSKSMRFPKWVAEAGDCDNASRNFASYLSLCEWLKAARANTPLGNLTAGILRFCPDNAGGQGHAICWAVGHDGVAMTFDVQIMDFRALSASEKLSIYGGESI